MTAFSSEHFSRLYSEPAFILAGADITDQRYDVIDTERTLSITVEHLYQAAQMCTALALVQADEQVHPGGDRLRPARPFSDDEGITQARYPDAVEGNPTEIRAGWTSGSRA